MIKFLSWIAFALMGLSLVVCDIGTTAEAGRISIAVAADGTARSLLPNLDTDVASYDISGTGPFSEFFTAKDVLDGRHDVGGLVPGEWTVTAIGKNSAGTEIVEASATVEVKAAETAEVTLLCMPFAGTGKLVLQLSWPTSLVASPTVDARLTPLGGKEESISFPAVTSSSGLSSVSWTDEARANGYYVLTLTLRSTGSGATSSVWGVTETVLVLKNAVTTGSWTLDASSLASGGIAIAVDSNGLAPIDVIFSGGDAELLQGYPQTITASASPSANSWRWYLNATELTGSQAHSSALTLDTSSLVGGYWLNVIAGRGSDRGSAGFQFKAYPNDSSMEAYSGLLAGYACNKATIEESSKGVYELNSGPGDGSLEESELEGKSNSGLADGQYRGGKAYLGIPGANGKALTEDFRITFTRNVISSKLPGYTGMYVNLIVEGDDVENDREGRGILIALTPAATEQVVIDGSSKIDGVYGGTIDGIGKGSTLADLAAKNVTFVNAVTKDYGTPINKKLAAVLIIVGDSRGIDTDGGNMANVVMTVSDVSWKF